MIKEVLTWHKAGFFFLRNMVPIILFYRLQVTNEISLMENRLISSLETTEHFC